MILREMYPGFIGLGGEKIAEHVCEAAVFDKCFGFLFSLVHLRIFDEIQFWSSAVHYSDIPSSKGILQFCGGNGCCRLSGR